MFGKCVALFQKHTQTTSAAAPPPSSSTNWQVEAKPPKGWLSCKETLCRVSSGSLVLSHKRTQTVSTFKNMLLQSCWQPQPIDVTGKVMLCLAGHARLAPSYPDRTDQTSTQKTTWSIDLVSLPNGFLTSSQPQTRKSEGPPSGNGAPDASEHPSALVCWTSCWPPCARTHVYGKQMSTLPMGMWLPIDNPAPLLHQQLEGRRP